MAASDQINFSALLEPPKTSRITHPAASFAALTSPELR